MPTLTLEQVQLGAIQRLAQRRLADRRLPDGSPLWHAQVLGRLRTPHEEQARFISSPAKRKVIRAGRRGGKTVGGATLAVQQFLAGRRILYAVPTQDQVDRFWFEVKRAFEPAIDTGVLYKNETRHLVEIPRTETRIRAKTAWDADTLRGDYCDLLILDEYQMMSEDAWGAVGAPMLLDNNGDAVFIYTPPSLRMLQRTQARDPRHAAKLYATAAQDTTGRWATFHFASQANPYVSEEALAEITGDMTRLSYTKEILAEDSDETPGALWTQALIDAHRWEGPLPEFVRIVIGLDPGHDAGIIAAGRTADGRALVLEDLSISGDPDTWAQQGVGGYHKYHADALVPERNHGGEMVETTIKHVDATVNVKTVWASHGKYARAEPVSVLYPKHRVYHVGVFSELEAEMCHYVPNRGLPSPNRYDALVWALTELMLDHQLLPEIDFGSALDTMTQPSRWGGHV